MSPKKSNYSNKSTMNVLFDESTISQLENSSNLEYFD